MKRFALVLGVLTAVLPASACLKIDTSHTLYLSPDGAVSWMVRQGDVHSDEQDPAKRSEEEAGFVREIQESRNGPLTALEALGGTRVSTVLTRAERPWEAVTTGRFERVDALAAALLRDLGIEGSAALSSHGNRTTLGVRWKVAEASTEESAAVALLDEITAYRLVLTDGRFVAGDGIAISDDGRVARLTEQNPPPGGEYALSLTWAR
jgi:hypothetical protein